MAPPSATETLTHEPTVLPKTVLKPTDPQTTTEEAIQKVFPVLKDPSFNDKYEEREYQKGRLALAFRIFAKFEFDEAVAGHITLRDPVEPTSLWVNPWGIPWRTLKASDLIRVDAKGNVVDGGECRILNIAAYQIHHAVHSARPEVKCVAHAHSPYGRAFCSLGRTLDIISQDACAFYNDLALHQNFKGPVLAGSEGRDIAEALGHRKAALLMNHGLITCGQSVESAVFWFIHLERCCRVQLLADAAATARGHETVKISDEEAVFSWKIIGSEVAGKFQAKPEFDQMASQSGDEYKQ